MYPLLPGHVRNEQFCTADTAVRKVFAMPRPVPRFSYFFYRLGSVNSVLYVLFEPKAPLFEKDESIYR